jgi:hypothetical protein
MAKINVEVLLPNLLIAIKKFVLLGNHTKFWTISSLKEGYAVTLLVEELRYESESRGFDFRCVAGILH